MTVDLARTGDRSNVLWRTPSSGLWVGTRHGEYAGMVERVDGMFGARDALGRDLGSFGDVDSALAAVGRAAVDVLAGLTAAREES